MKTRILPLALGMALVLPSLAFAAYNTGNVTPADARTMPAQNTLQSKVIGPDGELLATQPGRVEINDPNMNSSMNRNMNNGMNYSRNSMNTNVNTGNVTPADMRTVPAPNTLQSKIIGPDGELLATQPGRVEINDPNMNSNMNNRAGYNRNSINTNVNTGNVTPADMRIMPAPNTLQRKIEGPSGELLATQPGEVEINELAVAGTRSSSPNLRYNQPLLLGEQVQSGTVTPADVRTTPAPITLQQKIQGPRGELVATQPGEVEFIENRRISVR